MAALFAVTATTALAQAPAASKRILTCRDKNGQVLITDPADPRCYKPPKTPDEQAADDVRRQKAKDAYNKCKAEERSSQSLLSRYPNKEKHDAARRQALAEIETSLRLSQQRLEQLMKERQRLRDEAEFYPKGNLPPRLRRDIDSNSALIQAQTEAIASQKDAAAQKNAFYDDELATLRRLWAPQGERRGCVFPQD